MSHKTPWAMGYGPWAMGHGARCLNAAQPSRVPQWEHQLLGMWPPKVASGMRLPWRRPFEVPWVAQVDSHCQAEVLNKAQRRFFFRLVHADGFISYHGVFDYRGVISHCRGFSGKTLRQNKKRKKKKRNRFNPLYHPAMPFCQKKNKRIFSVQYCHNLKKYHPLGNLKYTNLGIVQSLKFRILMGKKSFQFLFS